MASNSYPDPSFNPFTDDDLDKLQREEKSTSTEEGWNFVKRDDHTEVWRKQDPDKPVHLIKGFITFKDIPPKAVVDIVHDVESRSKWDKLFPIIEVLDSFENHRVVYWYSKMPFGVFDRDLVQKICTRHEEAQNTTFILYYHTTHQAKPPVSGIVRAETIRSGVIIRPHPDLPNSTRMSLLFQVDMKGWIPHFIVNAFAAKAPGGWHDNLSTYYWGEYSTKKNADSDK